jgi:hypothetical protein
MSVKVPLEQRLGEEFGIYTIVGVVGEGEVSGGLYRVRCGHCGAEHTKPYAALRSCRAKGTPRCTSCRTYVSRGAQPGAKDIGLKWVEGEGFVNTELGNMQQDFICGRMRPPPSIGELIQRLKAKA